MLKKKQSLVKNELRYYFIRLTIWILSTPNVFFCRMSCFISNLGPSLQGVWTCCIGSVATVVSIWCDDPYAVQCVEGMWYEGGGGNHVIVGPYMVCVRRLIRVDVWVCVQVGNNNCSIVHIVGFHVYENLHVGVNVNCECAIPDQNYNIILRNLLFSVCHPF